MRGHRLPRPYRAHLAGGLVADGDHDVHLRRVLAGKLIPWLAAQPAHGNVVALEQFQRVGIHLARGEAARAVRAKPSRADAVEVALSEDATSGVSGAQEEDVEYALAHAVVPLAALARGGRGNRDHRRTRRAARALCHGFRPAVLAIDLGFAECPVGFPRDALRIGDP